MPSMENKANIRANLWSVSKGSDLVPHLAELSLGDVGGTLTPITSMRTGQDVIGHIVTKRTGQGELIFEQTSATEIKEALGLGAAAAPRNFAAIGSQPTPFALTFHDPQAGEDASGDIHFYSCVWGTPRFAERNGIKAMIVPFLTQVDSSGNVGRIGPATDPI